MRNNTNDNTLQREYIRTFKFLVKEYELVKEKKHNHFKKVKEFYEFHNTCAKTFMKYYHRYKQSNEDELKLLPQKRWPKRKSRRPYLYIENKVIEQRLLWNNKYEIFNILKPKLWNLTPSFSWIYNICKRYWMNKLSKPMKQSKRKIIKERIWQMGHIDCHYLPKWIISWDFKTKYYLLALMDDYTRIVEVQIIKRLKSLDVMFATLKIINFLNNTYNIKFEEILSDNWPEFWIKTSSKKEEHPFERMLIELWIKHRYTKAYRPQTNWKIERFWRTIEEDLISETSFDSYEEFEKELYEYVYYFNNHRSHSSLEWLTPIEFSKKSLPN